MFKHTMTRRTACLALVIVALFSASAIATPPYGDPNQPYDRLPGTLETYHVKWAKPLAGKKLNVLFVTPYNTSREIVETAQRLDLKATHIMAASNRHWTEGISEGNNATPLSPTEARTVIAQLVQERLNLDRRYDAIVIGSIAWDAIPGDVRDLILAHVKRGTGLVYVNPNQLKADGAGQFSTLFETTTSDDVAQSIYAALPMDSMPLHRVDTPAAFKPITGQERHRWAQASVCITATAHGEGRVMGLDYFDQQHINYAFRNQRSLSPWIPDKGDVSLMHDRLMYDYAFALLTRCILWASAHESDVALAVSVEAPETDLTAPVDQNIEAVSWSTKTPAVVIDRDDCPESSIQVTLTPHRDFSNKLRIHYTIRDRTGTILKVQTVPVKHEKDVPVTQALPVPTLGRGTYFADVRVIDHADNVLAFASQGFRIESKSTVMSVTTDKDAYAPDETILGEAIFSGALSHDRHAAIRVVDTWGRTVHRAAAALGQDRTRATFTIPVHRPLSRMWDIYVEINDAKGVVDARKIWVGLPNWTFDDFMWMTIFAPHPGAGWMGNLYHETARKHGINSVFTYLIYNMRDLYEHNERLHMQSVSYFDHFGEAQGARAAAGEDMDNSKENSNSSLPELSRMYDSIAETGKPLDPEAFPYQFPQGHHVRDAGMINRKMEDLKVSAKFGSPLYVVTGEEYMLGGGPGGDREFSGFDDLTTSRFQAWCREQFKADLGALNAEWGSTFQSWDEVRGILIMDAVNKDQLPRWVSFRSFMRSHVWSQVFIDMSRAMKRVVPEVRTGKVGHDHHDFTRYKEHMSVSKLYIVPHLNIEWQQAIKAEVMQSFTDDNTFLLGSASNMKWSHNFQSEVANVRYPWKMLFMGLNGFDWEELLFAGFGGDSSYTPDFSEKLPFFENISREVLHIQKGIGKLTIAAKPVRSEVAMLWGINNHFISRLLPFQENGFSGGWMYNASIADGAHSDALALFMSLRIRPTLVSPEDVKNGDLLKRGFTTLVLPYSKGMSTGEADAILAFVKQGGLVIADNQPATYSEHGRELETGRLGAIFPELDKTHLMSYGKGHGAYIPGQINGYLGRVESCDYTGADTVAALLKEYAGITSILQITDDAGVERRDTFMPAFELGSTRLVGLMRMYTSKDKESDESQIRFERKYHVWDVRQHEYLGHVDALSMTLDLHPRFLALLPANPGAVRIASESPTVKQASDCVIKGTVAFADAAASEELAQVVQIRVYDPDGKECEYYRKNILFKGQTFRYEFPVSYTEAPDRYTVVAEHAITGHKAQTHFDVIAE